MSSKRPKRTIIQKNLDYNDGMLWQEERDLRKALYASLHPGRLKDSGDEATEDEDDEVKFCHHNHVCHNHQARNNYDAASSTSNTTVISRTVTSAPSTPTVVHARPAPSAGQQPFSTSSAPATPMFGSISAPATPTLAVNKKLIPTPTSVDDDDLARTIERVIQNGVEALAASESNDHKKNPCLNSHLEKCECKGEIKDKVKDKTDCKDKSKEKEKRKEKKHKKDKKEKHREKKDKDRSEKKEKKHKDKKKDKEKKEKPEKERKSKLEKEKKDKSEKENHDKSGKVKKDKPEKAKEQNDKSEAEKTDVSQKEKKDHVEKEKKNRSDKEEKKKTEKDSKSTPVKSEKKPKIKCAKKVKDQERSETKDPFEFTDKSDESDRAESKPEKKEKIRDKSHKKEKDRSDKKEKDKSKKKEKDKSVKEEKDKSDKKEKDKSDKKEKDKSEKKEKDKSDKKEKDKRKIQRNGKPKEKMEKKDTTRLRRKIKDGEHINNCNKTFQKLSSRERLKTKAREKQKEKAQQKLKEKLTKKTQMTKEKIVKKIRRRRMKDRKCKMKTLEKINSMVTRSRDLTLQRLAEAEEERKKKVVMETLRNRNNQRKTMVQRRRESMAEVLLKKRITRSMEPLNTDAALKTKTSGTPKAQLASNAAAVLKATKNSSKPCVQAQRKFAHSLPSSPSTTPMSTPQRAACGSKGALLLNYCPKTEDFLTFLCLRESPPAASSPADSSPAESKFQSRASSPVVCNDINLDDEPYQAHPQASPSHKDAQLKQSLSPKYSNTQIEKVPSSERIDNAVPISSRLNNNDLDMVAHGITESHTQAGNPQRLTQSADPALDLSQQTVQELLDSLPASLSLTRFMLMNLKQESDNTPKFTVARDDCQTSDNHPQASLLTLSPTATATNKSPRHSKFKQQSSSQDLVPIDKSRLKCKDSAGSGCGDDISMLRELPTTEDFLDSLLPTKAGQKCPYLWNDVPSLPPHLDLFGISDQIQEKAEPPEFPLISGVEPLPADRPGSPASSLTTTEEESANESWEMGHSIRARAPSNATCQGAFKPCSSSEANRRTLAPPCLTPIPPPIAAIPHSHEPPPLICMVPTKTEPGSPNSDKMPNLKMPSLKRPNSLYTRGPNSRLSRPSLVKQDQKRNPTLKVKRNNRTMTNGIKKEVAVKKVKKEVVKSRREKKLVNNVHLRANNVAVRKLKRKRKIVDYAEASSSDSMDEESGNSLKFKKKRKLRSKAACTEEPSPRTVKRNLKNHKHKKAINLLVRSKRIRLQEFSRKSSIQLIHDSKLLLSGKIREDLKITVNSFTSNDTTVNNVRHKTKNHVMNNDADKLELADTRTTNHNSLSNHIVTPNALYCENEDGSIPVKRSRGRPRGSKNKPKSPISGKNLHPALRAASASNSPCKVNGYSNGKDDNTTTSSTILQDAPVFRPTTDEWQDPMEYMRSISQKAESSGMCKIIPPKGWRPECKVDEDMRFTPQVQYIHRLHHRWESNVQELACIKKHVAAQDNDVAQSPQIGGCEIDLVRFSQLVTQQGGLKMITSKQKWNKVADQLKIPKTIQSRVGKLDSIYCKYLLSYDTLTKEEKDKLLADVETERRQMLAKKANRHMRFGITECQQMKGRSVSVGQYCRTANNIRQMHFKTDPSPSEVEREYWRVVEEGQSHVAVTRASLDTSVTGRHNWNLTNVSHNSGNLLHVLPGRMGITSPELKIGMLYSTEAWNRDRHSLPAIEYLHTGAPKIWYCIPSSEVNRAELILQSKVPDLCPTHTVRQPQRHLLMNQSFLCMIAPQVLLEAGIPVHRIEQNSEEFVMTFPGAAFSSISCGYNTSEAIHCASPGWLATGVQSFKLSRLLRQPCLFSMDQLLCLLSTKVDSQSNLPMLQVMLTEFKAIREREMRLRKELCKAGLKSSIRFGEPESPSVCRERRGKILAKSAEEKYCCVCKFACYLSMVVNEREDSVYCLEHGLEQLQAQKTKTSRNLKLMYRYDEFQLSQVVQDIEAAIASHPKPRRSSTKDVVNSKPRTPVKISSTTTKNSASPATGQKLHNSKELFPVATNSSSPSPSSLPRNCLVKGMSAATNKLRASPDIPSSSSQVTPPRSGHRNSPKGTPQEPTSLSSPKSPGRSRRESSSSTTSTSSKPTLRSTSPRGTPVNSTSPRGTPMNSTSPRGTPVNSTSPRGTPISSPRGTPMSSPKGSPRGTPHGSPRHSPAYASKPPVLKPMKPVVPRNVAKVSPMVVLNDTLNDGDGPPTPPTTRSHVKAEPEEGIAL